MKKFIAVTSTGEIRYTVSHAQDAFYINNPILGDLTFHEVSMEFDDNAMLSTHYWAGELRTRSAKPSQLHYWDLSSLEWLINLEDAKIEGWARIKSSRSQAEYAGFIWDSSKFDSDQLSQGRISAAVMLAKASSEFTTDWILFDNTTRSLASSEMIQVGVALSQHIATQFAKSITLRNQINLAIIGDEVDAAVW